MPYSGTGIRGIIYLAAPPSGMTAQQIVLQYGFVWGLAGSSTAGGANNEPILHKGEYILEELLTIAASANSNGTANLLPANSLIDAVLGRVTVAIPTATTFNVGDATQAARFASGVAVAVNTTFVGTLHQNPAVASDNLGPRQTAVANIRVTPSATPANANGRVRLQSVVTQFVPPAA